MMINKIVNYLKYLKCAYKYRCLDKEDRALFKAMGIDPKSILNSGGFNNE